MRVLPLSALANPVQDELTAVTMSLASIGHQLDAHETGTGQGLRWQRNSLLSRQRGLVSRTQRPTPIL